MESAISFESAVGDDEESLWAAVETGVEAATTAMVEEVEREDKEDVPVSFFFLWHVWSSSRGTRFFL